MPLEIQDLTLRFGGLKALDGVSLVVPDGQLLAIVGPNGAGKTALLNCINGVYRPTGGSIVFNGNNLTSRSVHEIAHLGIGRAFQHAELFPHLTVVENLLISRHLSIRSGILRCGLYFGVARREEEAERKKIEEIIDFFELYRYRDVTTANLPYGVQKLVGVARALALEPRLLLLDEPSTGLMREEKENFARFLLRIRHELGLTIIWIEHDMQMVVELADRIAVLNYGRVIADGTPDNVRRDRQVIEAFLGVETT